MYANLARGEHTLREEYNSEFFGGAYSSTYYISVVPEPSALVPACIGALGFFGYGRQRRNQNSA